MLDTMENKILISADEFILFNNGEYDHHFTMSVAQALVDFDARALFDKWSEEFCELRGTGKILHRTKDGIEFYEWLQKNGYVKLHRFKSISIGDEWGEHIYQE